MPNKEKCAKTRWNKTPDNKLLPFPVRPPLSPLDWEKETIHRPAPVQNFSLQKKKGSTEEDFGGGYGFPGFYRVFVSTTGLESFSFRPEKVLHFLSVVVVYVFSSLS